MVAVTHVYVINSTQLCLPQFDFYLVEESDVYEKIIRIAAAAAINKRLLDMFMQEENIDKALDQFVYIISC